MDAIARELPRGYGKLSDQLRRALLGAYLQFTEAAAREGRTLKGLGIDATAMETVVPSYLWRFSKTGQFKVRGVA